MEEHEAGDGAVEWRARVEGGKWKVKNISFSMMNMINISCNMELNYDGIHDGLIYDRYVLLHYGWWYLINGQHHQLLPPVSLSSGCCWTTRLVPWKPHVSRMVDTMVHSMVNSWWWRPWNCKLPAAKKDDNMNECMKDNIVSLNLVFFYFPHPARTSYPKIYKWSLFILYFRDFFVFFT